MTDLQTLVRQTSNPSILKMQQILHEEVIQLGKIATELKESNTQWSQIVERKERDWLTISRETDETIATQKAEIETLKLALLEVIKVLESDDSAIVDTVWVSTGQPETLRDHCHHAVYGYMYQSEERT